MFGKSIGTNNAFQRENGAPRVLSPAASKSGESTVLDLGVVFACAC